jgi:hypothetical protein
MMFHQKLYLETVPLTSQLLVAEVLTATIGTMMELAILMTAKT